MSVFGSVIGGIVGFAVGGPVGAAAGAAIGGSKAASNAVDAAGHVASDAVKYTEEFVEGVGKVIVAGGVFIIDAVSDVAQAVFGVAEGVVAFRPLRPSELKVARDVFGTSVPLDRVVLSSLTGAQNRQFTLPGSMLESSAWAIPGVGPALEVAYLIQGLSNKYVIFIGREGYNNPFKMARDTGRKGQTLIHELTHVWQGHNQVFQWSYVLNSLWNQCKCAPNFNAAYNATPGQQWRTYAAEQQARLIEDWYVLRYGATGPSLSTKFQAMGDQLQAYLDCNIRPARPNADTIFPPPPTGTTASRLSSAGLLAPRPGQLLHPQGNAAAARFTPFRPR